MRKSWLALLFIPLVARADDVVPPPVEELELASLLDLEVSAATKRPTRLSESPAVGNAFVHEQLDDYGWLTLNEILYTQPGFFPTRDYERRTVGARGEHQEWNNNRLLLLVDGMPHNDVETGTAYTWEVTPLFMARSVEVLRGPGSALYGSYALNGVVSIDTLNPADLGGNAAEARLLVGPGTATADVMVALSSRDADVLLAYNRVRTDGIKERGVDASGRLAEDGSLRRFDIDDQHGAATVFLKVVGKGITDGFTLTAQHQAWEFATGRGWIDMVPDVENMRERRLIASLRYRTPTPGTWTHEYALQFQRHGYRQDVGLYPAGAFDGFYPDGASESIDTDLSNLFARAQLARALPKDGRALAGVEYTGLLYGGDTLHTGNFDPNSPDGSPLDGQTPLGPTYEPIVDRLVSKLGVYAQLGTGALLGERFELTLGMRYDNLWFNYTDIKVDGGPTRSKSFQDFSPRAALIVHVAESLVLKLMAAHAFRTPTVIELFGANTYTTAPTDIDTFEAERQDTLELAADWRIGRPLKLRANGWLSRLDGSIGYSVDELLIVNRYDAVRAGGEVELTAEHRLGGGTRLDGWLSWSYTHELSETVRDPELAEADRLTRAPAQTAKLGARLRHGPIVTTLQGLFVGDIHRRASDLANESNRAMRDDVVPAWLSVDAALHVRALDWLRAGVVAKNVFASGGKLPAIRDVPFDYPVEPRRVLFELALDL